MTRVALPTIIVDEPYSDIEGFRPSHLHGGKLRKLLIRVGVPYECAECRIFDWRGKPLTLHVDHIDGDKRNNTLSNLRFLCPNCHSQSDTYCGRNKRKYERTPINAHTVRVAYTSLADRGVKPSASLILKTLGRAQYTSLDKDMVTQLCFSMGLTLRRKSSSDRDIDVPVVSVKRSRRDKVEWDDAWLAEAVKTMPLTEIGRILGVSDNAVKKHCVSVGIEIPSRRRVMYRARKSRGELLKDLETSHGTRRGYKLELRLNLPTCDACRFANRNR